FPFNEGENPLLIVTRILNGPRPTLMRVRTSLAPELATTTPLLETLDRELVRALAADPNARHEPVMEFWKAIEPPLRAAVEERGGGLAAPRGQVSPYEATARAPSDGKLPVASPGTSGVHVRDHAGALPGPGRSARGAGGVAAANAP